MLDPTTHNYIRKISALRRQGKLPMAFGLNLLDIYHDDWCGIYQGRRCDCDPDIRLRQHPHLDPNRN